MVVTMPHNSIEDDEKYFIDNDEELCGLNLSN